MRKSVLSEADKDSLLETDEGAKIVLMAELMQDVEGSARASKGRSQGRIAAITCIGLHSFADYPVAAILDHPGFNFPNCRRKGHSCGSG